jgi:hypothetical protein
MVEASSRADDGGALHERPGDDQRILQVGARQSDERDDNVVKAALSSSSYGLYDQPLIDDQT